MTIELSKYNFAGPGIDVSAPEEGSNNWHMDMIKDTYHTIYGFNDINMNAIVTGKSQTHGGFKHKEKNLGSGIYFNLKELFQNSDYANYREKFDLEEGLSN